MFLPSFICERICLRISLQIFFGKDIFGHGFGQDFSLDISFVDFFLKYFSVGVAFENCFAEIPLQGVCGRNVSSNTFSVEVSAEICLVYISLQRVLGREIVKTILANMFCFFFRGDSSFQAFGRECLFRDSLAENFVTYFLVVISFRLLGKHFLFSSFFEEISLQNLFGGELLF